MASWTLRKIGLLTLLLGFHLLHQLGKGFPKFLFGELSAVHDQGDNFLFNFFLHDLSRSLLLDLQGEEGTTKAEPQGGAADRELSMAPPGQAADGFVLIHGGVLPPYAPGPSPSGCRPGWWQ